jgi:hypothetical protein
MHDSSKKNTAITVLSTPRLRVAIVSTNNYFFYTKKAKHDPYYIGMEEMAPDIFRMKYEQIMNLSPEDYPVQACYWGMVEKVRPKET